MFGISAWELLLVGVVLFLVVGPAKLPGLAKQIGNGIKDLRKGLGDLKGTVDKDDEFVKAVGEARRTIAEAKADLRSLIDVTDDGDEDRATDRHADDSWDPSPKRPPRGLQRVGEPTVSDEENGDADDPVATPPASRAPDAEAAAPEPVENEQSRPGSPPPVGKGVPAEPTGQGRTGRTGRKMIRPGRTSPNVAPRPTKGDDG